VADALLTAAANETGILCPRGQGLRLDTRKRVKIVRDERAEDLDNQRRAHVRNVEYLRAQAIELLDANLVGDLTDFVFREWGEDGSVVRTSLIHDYDVNGSAVNDLWSTMQDYAAEVGSMRASSKALSSVVRK
jgi:hypothetical protein